MDDQLGPWSDEQDLTCTHDSGHVQASPAAPDRVVRALNANQRAAAHRGQRGGAGLEVVGRQRQHALALRFEQLTDRALLSIALLVLSRIELREQSRADLVERVALRDGHQVLPADGLAARLDSALVVAGT